MKLPHYVQLALAFAVVTITWIMNQAAAGALVLPAAVITTLTIVKTVVGLLSDSVQTSSSTPPERGFAKLGVLSALACIGPALLLGAVLSHCKPAAYVVDCGSRIAEDALNGMTLTQVVADVEGPCGLDLAGVIAYLAASNDTKLQATGAYREAVAFAAAHRDGGS